VTIITDLHLFGPSPKPLTKGAADCGEYCEVAGVGAEAIAPCWLQAFVATIR
jgi:hypothetical protein